MEHGVSMKMLQELQFSSASTGRLREALPRAEGRDGVGMHRVVAEPSHSIHRHRCKPVCQRSVSVGTAPYRQLQSHPRAPARSFPASLRSDAGSDGRGRRGQCPRRRGLGSPRDPRHGAGLAAAEPARGRSRASASGSPRIAALACDSRFT